MKTAKYRKRCFDHIEDIVAENKALTSEVDRLRLEAEKETKEKAAQEERMMDLTRRLADKDREKKGKSSYWRHLWLRMCSVSLTNSHCCRSGGGNRMPLEREGPA